MDNIQIWWVVVRVDNNYPLLIYPDKARAELVVKNSKFEKVVKVQQVQE